MLAVDNMHGGKNEMQDIRVILEEGIKMFDELPIPASWLVLSLCLRKQEERTADLESVKQLASDLGIDKDEVLVALCSSTTMQVFSCTFPMSQSLLTMSFVTTKWCTTALPI